MTSVQLSRALRLLSVLLFLLIWVLFHGAVIASFLPNLVPTQLSVLDDVVYAEIGWGLCWLLGSALLRARVLHVCFRKSHEDPQANLLASAEMAFALPASGLLWCLAFAKGSSHYWPWEVHLALSNYAAFGELAIMVISAVVALWVWGAYNGGVGRLRNVTRGVVGASSQCVIQVVLLLSPWLLHKYVPGFGL